jgi:hypothetical protein
MCWGARRLCALPWERLPPGSDNENRPAAGDPRAIEPWGRSRRPPPAGVHARYHKPIWLTGFALGLFRSGPVATTVGRAFEAAG